VPLRACTFDFTEYMGRADGVCGQQNHYDPRSIYCANDGVRVELARCHVPGGDPAHDSGALEGFADGFGPNFVLRRIADKNVAGHFRDGRSSASRFKCIFRHRPPPEDFLVSHRMRRGRFGGQAGPADCPTALAGGPSGLVTVDKHFLALGESQGIAIIKPGKLLAADDWLSEVAPVSPPRFPSGRSRYQHSTPQRAIAVGNFLGNSRVPPP